MNQKPKYLDEAGVTALLNYINVELAKKLNVSQLDVIITQDELEQFFAQECQALTEEELDEILT